MDHVTTVLGKGEGGGGGGRGRGWVLWKFQQPNVGLFAAKEGCNKKYLVEGVEVGCGGGGGSSNNRTPG